MTPPPPRLAGLAAVLLALPLSAATPRKAPVPPVSAPAAKPTLAVVISVDGLSWDRLQYYRPWYQAGLKRLLDEGRLYSRAFYRHLNTETAPGHASLGTGAPPRVTGIVANRWYEARDDGSLRQTYCTDEAFNEADNDVVYLPGPKNLRVPTFADRLVESNAKARVVSLSGKDRGAIFLAGKSPKHAVYWFDQDSGRFVSSPAYDERSPAGAVVKSLVTRFNRAKAGAMLPARFGLLWKKIALPYPPAPPPSEPPLPRPASAASMRLHQLPVVGLGWDHDVSTHEKGYFTGFYYSPLVDEVTADLALAVLEDTNLELGHGEDPDLLMLSFSGQDTVSHMYGTESEENLDTLRRLDQQLGRIFEHLDRAFPKGRVVVALSADHGFPFIPEAEKKRDKTFTGGRIFGGSFPMLSAIDRTNRLVSEELCLPPDSKPLIGAETWDLFYDKPSIPLFRTIEGPCGPAGRPVAIADVDRALRAVIRKYWAEEIQDVFFASESDRWPDSNPATPFVRNAFTPGRAGDAMLIARRGVIEHWDAARGANHGTIHDYDTHVPLLFWGDPFPKGTVDDLVAPYDLAPTLAKLFGVSLPTATGKSLLR